MRVPDLATTEGAVVELREALRVRGFESSVIDGPMTALRHDPKRLLDSDDGDEAWPRGAWLVQSLAGRWWVWGVGTATPADETARRADGCAAAARHGRP